MGIFSSIMGKTKPVQANLDEMFALPAASITLQSAAGMSCSGHAGVCFKPPTGQGFEEMQAEVVSLLSMDGTGGLHQEKDSFGYQWLVVEDTDIEQLVTRIHLVNSSLSDSGWGPQLLCSVFGLADLPDGSGSGALPAGAASGADAGTEEGTAAGTDSESPALVETSAGPGTLLPSTGYLVYLFKRGTFYPFVPDGHEHRDTEQELRLKSLVADDLTVETDLDRWFPLWDLPVG
jgi:hypothetical protein